MSLLTKRVELGVDLYKVHFLEILIVSVLLAACTSNKQIPAGNLHISIVYELDPRKKPKIALRDCHLAYCVSSIPT